MVEMTDLRREISSKLFLCDISEQQVSEAKTLSYDDITDLFEEEKLKELKGVPMVLINPFENVEDEVEEFKKNLKIISLEDKQFEVKRDQSTEIYYDERTPIILLTEQQ